MEILDKKDGIEYVTLEPPFIEHHAFGGIILKRIAVLILLLAATVTAACSKTGNNEILEDGNPPENPDGGGWDDVYEQLPADYETLASELFAKLSGTWVGFAFDNRQRIEVTIPEQDFSGRIAALGDMAGVNFIPRIVNTDITVTVSLKPNGNIPADESFAPMDAVLEIKAIPRLYRKSGDDDYTVRVVTISAEKNWIKKDKSVDRDPFPFDDLDHFSFEFEVKAGQPEGPGEGILYPWNEALTGMTKVA